MTVTVSSPKSEAEEETNPVILRSMLLKNPNSFKNFCVIILYVYAFGLFGLLSVFLKFHLALAFQNKTTLEKMDHDTMNFVSKYDVGMK